MKKGGTIRLILYVSLKILNSGLILKTLTHARIMAFVQKVHVCFEKKGHKEDLTSTHVLLKDL